jgi:hypothetical protein
MGKGRRIVLVYVGLIIHLNVGESGFMSKIDFDLLVAVEVLVLIREGFLAVEIILL